MKLVSVSVLVRHVAFSWFEMVMSGSHSRG
nr:MAG TPA: hypothetical protein [Caudoviricetes sp.]